MAVFNLILKSQDILYRIASIKHIFHEGSLYVSLVREKGKAKGFSGHLNLKSNTVENESETKEKDRVVKVTYHTSGIINFHNLSNTRIYSEPIFNISEKFCFLEYLINDLDRLIKTDEIENMLIFEVPNKNDEQYYSFALTISPEKSESPFSIMFYGGLFFLNIDIRIANPINHAANPAFWYLTPKGLNKKQILSDSSCVLYHQKINKTDGVIIYQPDKAGLYTMIYHQNRRSVPIKESLIKFKNPRLQLKFTTAKSNYARFYVIDSKNGSKIHDISNQIEQIIFDNELY